MALPSSLPIAGEIARRVRAQLSTFITISDLRRCRRHCRSAPEEASGEDIADPLIVARIKLEHVAIVADGSRVIAEPQQSACQTGSGAHVGSRLEKSPEMPGVFLEPFAS